ncbi:tripartite tricarboxylate transporter TctB family protein [Candidatus Spongiihabitans sp.]|uniref:tripartite tricarboxylate transporter TctB family protein n=1 Tax=Candidatus Spongiihabitans sp. TaxID=3101308 RepID=UPI003C6ED6FA
MMIRSTHAAQGWSAFFAVLLGIIFTAAAFWNTDPEIYLFPRIVAGLMLLLALAQWAGVVIRFVKNKSFELRPISIEASFCAESASTPRGLASGLAWKAFLPGIIVGIIYVLIMERLGFYASSLLTFVIITSIYGKHNALNMKAPVYKVGYNIIVGLIFMVFLYALFWRLLNVRTPTGLLF